MNIKVYVYKVFSLYVIKLLRGQSVYLSTSQGLNKD